MYKIAYLYKNWEISQKILRLFRERDRQIMSRTKVNDGEIANKGGALTPST